MFTKRNSFQTYLFFLIFSFLLIIIVLISSICITLINTNAEEILENNLIQNANLAKNMYNQRVQQITQSATILSENEQFVELIATNQTSLVNLWLTTLKETQHIDIVFIADQQNIRIDNQQSAPLQTILNKAKQSKIPILTTAKLPLSFSQQETQQKRIRKIPPLSDLDKITEEYVEESLNLVSVVPLFHEEQFLGNIVLMDILNNDNDIPFEFKSITGHDITVYLDDTAISTGIQTNQGTTYEGSSLSKQVIEETLKREKTVITRTWTSDQLSRDMYLPLRDYNNQVIGVLGVGIPESQFKAQKIFLNTFDIVQIVVFSALMLIIIAFSTAFFVSRRILQPVSKLTHSIDKAIAGNYQQGISLIKPFDEFEKLENHYNILIRDIRKLLEIKECKKKDEK